MLCKPCEERGRTREATRTVAGEPWCETCFCPPSNHLTPYRTGVVRTLRSDKLDPSPVCRCGAILRRGNRVGLCKLCKYREQIEQSRQAKERRPCKTENCVGTVTRLSKTGYCARCIQSDWKLRCRLYPSQAADKVRARALASAKRRKSQVSAVRGMPIPAIPGPSERTEAVGTG